MSHRGVSDAELAAMARALHLAAAHRPHPNPRVGSVVLDVHGAVVGEGAHVEPGTPHAESHALAAAGERAEGGTVVVTLEPCSFRGRTGPCTEAIIAAGVARVVAAMPDPDPRVSGSGFAALEQAGIEVVVGPMAAEAAALDPGYVVHRTVGRPRVVAVIAATLDGRVTGADGRPSAELLGEPALADLAVARQEADAVLVGSGYLDRVRPPLAACDRLRVAIVAGRRFPDVDVTPFATPPIVFGSGSGHVSIPDDDGKVDLGAALRHLGDQGHLDVLLEGGQALTSAMAHTALIDGYILYLAGWLAGSGRSPFDGTMARMGDARPVVIEGVRQIGSDLRVDIRVEEF